MNMRRISFLLIVLLLAACTLTWADEITDPEHLFIGDSNCPSPPGCGTYLGNEVNPLSTGTLTLTNNGSNPALIDPVLLIIGVPDNTGGTFVAPTLTLSTGTGTLGGPSAYLGLWNSTTGWGGDYLATSGGGGSFSVYDFLALSPPASNSEHFSNWAGAVQFYNGFTPNDFGIYVYQLAGTVLPAGNKSSVSITYGLGNLPIGTMIVAYGCSELNTTTGACKSVGKVYGTPFTQAGQVTQVPEPGSLVLLGTGLLGLVGMVRRKFSI
jgi:hypothetical protein